MDDSVKNLLKWGAIIGGVYLILKQTGLWEQIFGGGNSFADSASLLNYCHANPTGTATFNGHTLPCSQWLAAAPGASTPAPVSTNPQPSAPTPTPTTAVSIPAIDTALAAQLSSTLQTGQGRTLGTVSEWNWILTNQVQPGASIITQATKYAVDQQISAADYLALRQSLGMSGISGVPQGMGDWMEMASVHQRKM
jgi:hypothetical protein